MSTAATLAGLSFLVLGESLMIYEPRDIMGSYDNPAFPKAWAWQGGSSLVKAIAATKTTCVWVGPAYGKAGGQYNKQDDRVERAARFASNPKAAGK